MAVIVNMVYWKLPKQRIRWPTSHNHINGSDTGLIEVVWVKLTADQAMVLKLNRKLMYLQKLSRFSKKGGAPLLDLAKSYIKRLITAVSYENIHFNLINFI